MLPAGSLHPDLVNRLASEASATAEHVLRMCIRALDYCPPVDVDFGDFLRALITADYDVFPTGDPSYRVAFVESFKEWGIYPLDLRSLSPQLLRWRPLFFDRPKEILRDLFRTIRPFSEQVRYVTDDQAFFAIPEMKRMKHAPGERERLFNLSRAWRAKIKEDLEQRIKKLNAEDRAQLGRELGLDFTTGEESFEVRALRVSEKIGSLNNVQSQIILQVLQERKKTSETGETFLFAGGATLIADQNSLDVLYSISKNIRSERRKNRMGKFLMKKREFKSHLYFQGTPFLEAGERFAMLHRFGS